MLCVWCGGRRVRIGMCKNLTHGCKHTTLVSDYNTLVINSTGGARMPADRSRYDHM